MTPKKARVRGTSPMGLAASAVELTADMEDAIDEVMLWIKQNPKKWEEMIKEGGYKQYLRFLIREARHKRGQEIQNAARVSRKGLVTEEKVDREAKIAVGRGMNLYGLLAQMIGNKYFGDCTKKDLLESAEKRKAEGIGSLQKYYYHLSVADGLGNRQLVRSKFTNDDLRELLCEASRKAKSKVEAA
jgi:hypothetical protein